VGVNDEPKGFTAEIARVGDDGKWTTDVYEVPPHRWRPVGMVGSQIDVCEDCDACWSPFEPSKIPPACPAPKCEHGKGWNNDCLRCSHPHWYDADGKFKPLP
jgi:hypothetical protein